MQGAQGGEVSLSTHCITTAMTTAVSHPANGSGPVLCTGNQDTAVWAEATGSSPVQYMRWPLHGPFTVGSSPWQALCHELCPALLHVQTHCGTSAGTASLALNALS